MTTFQEYQQQFSQNLVAVLHSPRKAKLAVTSEVKDRLNTLINALPYYGSPAWQTAHREVLANLLETNLPNASVKPQPQESGFGYFNVYKYNGPFAGYRDAFFSGIALTSAADQVAKIVNKENNAIEGKWWGGYGVAILTDAVRQTISISLDTGKLAGDIARFHSQFLKVLAASYLGVFQTSYAPTATVLQAIIADGKMGEARDELTKAIGQERFTANINYSIMMGGDSSCAAVWFLFNLWITLKALGSQEVDNTIRQLQKSGLTVPGEIGPGDWWNGGYQSWYYPLSGSDVVRTAKQITASMPELETMSTIGGRRPSPPITVNVRVPNGYAQSLCNWGDLNWYNPPSGSCFGSGTGVLMANGSVKPIETIQGGDEVQSTRGARKVVLIETPRRAGLVLYQINNLNVFATSAHPFKNAVQTGPRRLAIDPWALMDGIPTMLPEGIGALQEGTSLSGRGIKEPKDIAVEHLAIHASDKADECVYDLLLEGWNRGDTTYFVGSKETFFAVDTETADPLHDMATSAAVVAAMEAALPYCRQQVRDPAAELPFVLTGLPVNSLIGAVCQADRADDRETEKPFVSKGPCRFMPDGQWDAHASYLEFHLVRQFGRNLRRAVAMGWRMPTTEAASSDHFVVNIHDLELRGEMPLPANTSVELEIKLNGGCLEGELLQTVLIDGSERPVWHLLLDRVIEFGQIHPEFQAAELLGVIKTGAQFFGRFRSVITEPVINASATPDYFIFAGDGHIIGRVSLSARRVSVDNLELEKQHLQQWTKQQALTMAVNLGRQIGESFRKKGGPDNLLS